MTGLRRRIRGGESATLEFKTTSPDPRRLARNLAAFANSAGGELFIGINDRGEVVGLDDLEHETGIVHEALAFIEPPLEVNIETIENQGVVVVAISVPVLGFPQLCHVVEDEEETLYFRIGAETRPVDRRVEKAVNQLRRHFGRQGAVESDGQRLLEFLWEKGEAREGICAHRLNYSSRRLRKLAERLVGAGYLIPCNLGMGRTYAAIHPGRWQGL